MATFTTQDEKLFIDGNEVIRGWESYSGWYWFATEKGKYDGEYFGFVQGHEEEWGYFNEKEFQQLKGQIWEIPKENLVFSGRRD